ncbi:hypothetical protein ACTFIY_006494 [Dictyostelium cf. discoideum]
MEGNQPIVVDNGSGLCKVGFSGEDYPLDIFPTIIGVPKYKDILFGVNQKDTYIGDGAQIKREKLSQVMFESFGIPSLYIGISSILSLYASGRTTGLVLEIGDGVTSASPIYQVISLVNSIERLDLAGRDITNYLMQILQERGYSFSTTSEREIINNIKDKLAFVSQDFQQSIVDNNKKEEEEISYELPDGQNLIIGNERFRCSEVLFQPSILGNESPGIHELTNYSIMKCDFNIRKHLYDEYNEYGASIVNTKF